jgi:hypothetical protein
MSISLTPIITTAGLQAVLSATNDGLQAKISDVAFSNPVFGTAIFHSGYMNLCWLNTSTVGYGDSIFFCLQAGC